RYAKGEISRAEYDTIRQDILRDRQMNLVSKATDRESSTATSTSDDVASAADASNNRDENVSV
ncbi:MAG: SHOCT domain-containing protein, partial [Caldilineaceae bacterium]|nr:SHOCT domain-containing protein [Caldilineaceae bacterium]